MTYVTMAALPLATISSFVELGLATRGLRKDQVFGKNGTLQSIGTEGGNMIRNGVNEIAEFATRRQGLAFEERDTTGTTVLKDLGYYDWDVGAATVYWC